MTATLAFHPTTPDYSLFGGNAEVLTNGNAEYDECADGPIGNDNAAIFEVTQTPRRRLSGKCRSPGNMPIEAMRIPSLYPGVQW